MMSEVITITKETLPMQLDSVSWNKKHNLLAVGAYMINPANSDERIGKIFLIRLVLKENEITSHEIIQEVETSGVLDLRWDPITETVLAVASSISLSLFELDKENQDKLKLKHSLDLTAMALYTQWNDTNSLVYSDSDGVVSIVTTDPAPLLKSSKKLHDNLTWVVQYSSQQNLLFAGSDEGKFTGFLLDNLEDDEKHYTKKFEVGVTSIIFFGKNIMAVGSYDDTLRIFTIDCTDPIVLSLKRKIEFGGALWRTLSFAETTNDSKDEENKFFIVAACARNGIHIINLNCETWAHEKLTSCFEFEGFLAYGLDAKLEQHNGTQKFIVASCYFDNNQLHLWKTFIGKT